VLQALVDHAVRHGTGRGTGVSRIEIRARRRNGTLELVVEDRGENGDGGSAFESPAPGAASTRAEGTSGAPDAELADTRTRLHQLYGSTHRFELGRTPGGGVRIDLEIPYRQAPNVREPDARRFVGRARADRRSGLSDQVSLS
jgi:LytS/YehU family sensor histidine kinase